TSRKPQTPTMAAASYKALSPQAFRRSLHSPVPAEYPSPPTRFRRERPAGRPHVATVVSLETDSKPQNSFFIHRRIFKPVPSRALTLVSTYFSDYGSA